jgi:hypothetical protein
MSLARSARFRSFVAMFHVEQVGDKIRTNGLFHVEHQFIGMGVEVKGSPHVY